MNLEFVEHLIKFDVETNRGEDDDNAVQVSTVHQSKGLEYKVVFVIDVATRKFPLKWNEKMFYVPAEISNSKQPASGDPKVEFEREERRILYVGMTRAEAEQRCCRGGGNDSATGSQSHQSDLR